MSGPKAAPTRPPTPVWRGLLALAATLVAALAVFVTFLLLPLLLMAGALLAYLLLRHRGDSAPRTRPSAPPTASAVPADRFGSGAW